MHVDVVAVLLVFCIAFTVSLRESNDNVNQQRHGRRHHKHEVDKFMSKINKEQRSHGGGNGGGGGGKKRGRVQALLGHQRNRTDPPECCPSETRMVELQFAFSRKNTVLEIYNNATKPQRFYEVVCLDNVENRTCHFVEPVLQKYSRCVQRYTYTYALVRDYQEVSNRHPNDDWRLDYIRVANGCSCEFQFPKLS